MIRLGDESEAWVTGNACLLVDDVPSLIAYKIQILQLKKKGRKTLIDSFGELFYIHK